MELANKVGASEIINRIVDDLKDENEQYRKMVMETIEKVSIIFSALVVPLTTNCFESSNIHIKLNCHHHKKC